MYAGSTVLESVYFANYHQSDEYKDKINAYMELQADVIRIFLHYKGKDESQIDFNEIKNDIIEMVELESDLANVSHSN